MISPQYFGLAIAPFSYEAAIRDSVAVHQPSTGQASSYNPRWRHRTDLSSVPFRNNAFTARLDFRRSLVSSPRPSP